MAEIGRVNCYGHCPAPDAWESKVYNGINRLYYIHGGRGGFIHRGKFTEFKSGHLYFFPFLVNVQMVSDKTDKIVHSYCDFELIPPIIASDVLEYNPAGDEITRAAISVFVAGAKLRGRDTASPKFDINDDFDRLSQNAISYLASRVAEGCGICAIKDGIIIDAIKYMHEETAEKITVCELAEKYHVNQDSFIRRFRRSVGITPYAYLKKLRIRTAFYLRDLGYTLDEAARQTGYSDAASLLHAIAGAK